MSRTVSEILKSVKIGEPQNHANMQIYPLYIQNGHERGYRTLEEALESQEINILEVSEGGSVPNLAVENTGKLPVLMVVGEELIGAKQNRVLNTSILVPAESRLNIPVSCVEQGRWAYRSRAFDSGSTTSHLRLRKIQTENVTTSLRFKQSFDANQSAVWQEVGRKMHSHDTTSHTAALHDVYEQTSHTVQEYLENLQPPAAAEGILVVINNEVVGGDLFDHAETLGRLWQKLLRGYALDAVERSHQTPSASLTDTGAFIRAAQEAVEEIYQSVGLGEDVRLSSDTVTGSGLLWGEKAVHTSLFNKSL